MGEINGIEEKKALCRPHPLPRSVKAPDGMSCTLMQTCMKSGDMSVACISRCSSCHQPALLHTTRPGKDMPETPLHISLSSCLLASVVVRCHDQEHVGEERVNVTSASR